MALGRKSFALLPEMRRFLATTLPTLPDSSSKPAAEPSEPKPLDPDAFLAHFYAQEDALAEKGFHRVPQWWREQLELFVRSGHRRWVVRSGRRGGKSTMLCRLSAAIVTFGAYVIPPGEVGILPIVSVDKTEATERIRTLEAILTALGEVFDSRAGELDLTERRVVIRVRACTTKAVVGFTSITIALDEVAKWESKKTKANPASEVLASLSPTTATQPNAWQLLFSSPWGAVDLHAELMVEGTNRYQTTSYAPSWISNPTLTEQGTRELQPDEELWTREYKGLPGLASNRALNGDDVLRAFRLGALAHPGSRFIAIDASSLRRDNFSWIVGGDGRDANSNVVLVKEVCSLGMGEMSKMEMSEVVERVAKSARSVGATTVFGDQREEASLKSLFSQHGLRFKPYAWSEDSKAAAFSLARRMLRENRLVLPPDAKELQKQALSCVAIQSTHGTVRYVTGGLDDLSCLITLMHAINARDFVPQYERVVTVSEDVPAASQERRKLHGPSGRKLTSGY